MTCPSRNLPACARCPRPALIRENATAARPTATPGHLRFPWRKWCRSLTGRRSFTRGNCAGFIPKFSSTKSMAKKPPSSSPTPSAAPGNRRQETAAIARRLRAVPGQLRWRRCGSLYQRLAPASADDVPFPPPANGQRAMARRIGVWRISSRQNLQLQARNAPAPNDYLGRIRRHGWPGTEGNGGGLQGQARRLQCHHGRGHGGPPGRGLCRISPQARARRMGLWPDRKPDAPKT